jgi:NAD(P)-dependent dehydrogenase (short-subunit alcohol dehydrogenase family)
MQDLASGAIHNDLRDKVCLITGGSRTLGAAIARRLAHYGAHVAINYHRSADAAQALCAELTARGVRASAIGADVTQPGDVTRLIADTWSEFGTLDIVVNNVGPYVDTPFLDLTLEDFDHIWAGNVRSTFLVCQTVGRRMQAQGHGQIINIAATDYLHRSHSIYGLAKSGVIYLTEALALELAPHVRINALAPDLIADNEEMAPEIAASAIAGTPLRRLVSRAEIAELVCLLCTPTFAMMTGQTLVLDGGRNIPRIVIGSALSGS